MGKDVVSDLLNELEELKEERLELKAEICQLKAQISIQNEVLEALHVIKSFLG